MDEPRCAAADRREEGGGLLFAFAQEAVAQGRGVRPCAEGEGNPHRLRQRRGAAAGGAGRRHRLPYGARALLLPQTREREVGGDGSGAERSEAHLQEGTGDMKPGLYETLERIAKTIEERKGGDPDKSYVAKLFAKGD